MPGSYDDRHGLRVSETTNRTGLLVATDRRFIFVDKQIGSLKVDDLPYGKISWVESSTGWDYWQSHNLRVWKNEMRKGV